MHSVKPFLFIVAWVVLTKSMVWDLGVQCHCCKELKSGEKPDMSGEQTGFKQTSCLAKLIWKRK